MKPVRLVIRRFLGLEDVVVDFDQGDLFVIVGPNGAGKSSILEALFFALYGRGIRVDRSRQELLHRGFPKDTMRVELEFFLGGKFLRVIREFSLKRGGGAVFEKREGEAWKPICSGEQAVNREIEKTLGFDASTFRSSVFLAQGETLTFIEATPADRFRILSSLFGLDILDAVREKARDDFNRLEGEIKPQEARLQVLAEKNLEVEKQRLEEEVLRVRDTLETLREEEEKRRKQLQNLERVLELSWTLEEERKRRKDLLDKREVALVGAQEDQRIAEAQRVKGEFWHAWQENLKDLRRIEEEMEKKREKLTGLKTEEARTQSLLEAIRRQKGAQEQTLATFREREKAFALLLPTATEIEKLKTEEAFLREEIKDIQEDIVSVQKGRKTAEEELGKIGQQVGIWKECLQLKEKELNGLKEGEKKAGPLYEERLNLLKDLESLQREERKLKSERERWSKEKEKAISVLQRFQKDLENKGADLEAFEKAYREKSRTFMVGELKKEWAERGVCPVCGTVVPFRGGEPEAAIDFLSWETHYRDLRETVAKLKAQVEYMGEQLEGVTKEAENAQREWERVRGEITEKERQKSAVEGQLREILRGLGWQETHFTMDMLRERIRVKETEVTHLRNQCTEKEKELALRKERQTAFQNRENELTVKLQEEEAKRCELGEALQKRREEILAFLSVMGIESELATAEAVFGKAWEELTERGSSLEKELNETRLEERGKEEKLQQLWARREELERELLILQGDWEHSQEEEKKAKEAFQAELERLGWDEAYFLELAGKKRGNWQEQLSAIEGSLGQLEERIDALKRERENLWKALQREYPMEDLVRVVEEEKEYYRRLRDEIGKKEHLLGRLNATLENVAAELAEWQTLIQEVAEKKKRRETLEKLLTALEARNFKNYLLAVLFKKLEEEASHFLFFLSGERYILRMSSEGGKAQMVVVDRRYGQEERFLHECSGGEKTLIALSLALAISRLWLKERGYKRFLDCLFIDEGFSPLDQEHLELVADAILRLGKDGKMVGIVTHDQSFAEYFPLRLEVREGRVSWKRNSEILTTS